MVDDRTALQGLIDGIDDTVCRLSVVEFARRKLGFEPDEWQADFLDSHERRILLNCCRQSGKSTCAAIKALHMALYQPKSLTLIVSPSENQSGELFAQKIKPFMQMLKVKPLATEDNKLRTKLENGSRILALPSSESTIRGYSAVNLLIEDEASRVDDAVHIAVTPMLMVSKGQFIMMSTPHGKRGHFYESWQGDNDWQKYHVTTHQCVRHDEAFRQRERAQGHLWYSQEYECQFINTIDSVFTSEQIEGIRDDKVEPIHLEPLGVAS